MNEQLTKVTIKKDWIFLSLAFFLLALPFQFALNPVPGVDLAVARLAILIIFFFFIAKHRNFIISDIKNNHITQLLLFFITLAILSLLQSQNIEWSIRKLLFLLSIFPIYLVSLKVFQNKEYRKKIFVFLVIGSFLMALISLIQFFLQFILGIEKLYSFWSNNFISFFLGNSFSQAVLAYPSWLVASQGNTYMRAIGFFPDPHMLSYYMGITLPFAIALAHQYDKKRFLFYFAAIIIFAADIFTFTRGGYIALIAAAFSIIPLVSKKDAIKIFSIIMFIIFIFTLVPNNPVSNRFNSSFDTNEGSNHARLSNFDQAAQIIKQNPLGVGIGMYPLAVNPETSYRTPIYAHNLYLDIAAELGVLSTAIFIFILFMACFQFWKKTKNDSFFLAATASLTLFSVHSLVETPLYSVHILPLFFVIIALAATINKSDETSRY